MRTTPPPRSSDICGSARPMPSSNRSAACRATDGLRVAGGRDEEIYGAIDRDWSPPELRELRGEIEAAEAHALPPLIERADLRGDLHSHTSETDSRADIRTMAEAARAAGL